MVVEGTLFKLRLWRQKCLVHHVRLWNCFISFKTQKKLPHRICVITAFSPRTLITSNYHSIVWCSLPVMHHFDPVSWVKYFERRLLTQDYAVGRLADGAATRFLWDHPGGAEGGQERAPMVQDQHQAGKAVLWPRRLHTPAEDSQTASSVLSGEWALFCAGTSTLGELRADDSVSKCRKSVVVRPCVCGESVCVVCVHSVCGRGALFCAGTIC